MLFLIYIFYRIRDNFPFSATEAVLRRRNYGNVFPKTPISCVPVDDAHFQKNFSCILLLLLLFCICSICCIVLLTYVVRSERRLFVFYDFELGAPTLLFTLRFGPVLFCVRQYLVCIIRFRSVENRPSAGLLRMVGCF